MSKSGKKASKKAISRATKQTAARGKGSANRPQRGRPTPPIPASRQGQR